MAGGNWLLGRAAALGKEGKMFHSIWGLGPVLVTTISVAPFYFQGLLPRVALPLFGLVSFYNRLCGSCCCGASVLLVFYPG